MLCLVMMLFVLGACSNGKAGEKVDASDYPNKAIEVIVPFAAGGSTDIGARILEKHLPKYLKDAQLVVVNKEGGSGTIALSNLYNSKADGYKLAVTTHTAAALQPLYGKTKYDYDSFSPIAKIFGNQQILVVRADSEWKTFEDWLEYVKKNPNKFAYGVAGGIGSGSHLPMAELEKKAGVKMKAVPFEGTPPAITAILGGHVDGAVLQPSDAKSLIDSGELRAIFNAASVPVPYYPEIPLLKDKGFDIVHDSNTSLVAPGNTPQVIVDKLQDAVQKTLEDPEVIKEFEKTNLQVQYASGKEVQEELKEKNENSKKILKEIKLIK